MAGICRERSGSRARLQGCVSPQSIVRDQLREAWAWREERGLLGEPTVRVFHGEVSGQLNAYFIDRFSEHFWVVSSRACGPTSLDGQIARFLKSKGALSATIFRPRAAGGRGQVDTLLGSPPQGRFVAVEGGVRFLVQFFGRSQPGLCLDHAPVRAWLRAHAHGWRVLHAFAYTGSLAVAAAMGGARRVTCIDLSTGNLAWARDAWLLNGLPEASIELLDCDVFAGFSALQRRGQRYDCVILDPPGFQPMAFSTVTDLQRLHEAALDVLAPGGFLVTSVHAAKPRTTYWSSEK